MQGERKLREIPGAIAQVRTHGAAVRKRPSSYAGVETFRAHALKKVRLRAETHTRCRGPIAFVKLKIAATRRGVRHKFTGKQGGNRKQRVVRGRGSLRAH